ncbi:MAG: Smr/MutS family protein [Deltaproteobacteria bacterium]|nr:Smr/MutS family protein [Deltaproteobacteria bacterium]
MSPRDPGDPDADLYDPSWDPENVTEPPLRDEIDLHTFRPKDCGDVVEEYVRAAQEAGMPRVRIIHGKGIGNLRRTVHAVLEKHPAVASFKLADERSGSWGATLVELKPL